MMLWEEGIIEPSERYRDAKESDQNTDAHVLEVGESRKKQQQARASSSDSPPA